MNLRNLFKNKSENRGLLNGANCNPAQAKYDPYQSKTPIKSIDPEYAQSISQIYRCVQLISDQVAQLPIIPYRVWNEKKTILYDSPVYKLFNHKINERMTKFMFIKIMVESMLLRGNQYQVIERNNQGDPVSLIYIPSDYVLPIYNPILFDQPVLYNVVGYDRLIEHSDMVHLMLKSIDGVMGISVIKYQALSLNIAINSDENANDFFASGSNIQAVIENPGKLTQQQKEDQIATLQKIKQNTGSTISVLEGGQVIKPISIDPSDAQLIETRQFNVLTLQNWFGVPQSKLNSKEGTSYNSAEMDQISFLTDTIQPILYRLEDCFEKVLLSDSQRIYTEIKFKIDDLLRTDLKSRGDFYRTMTNIGVFSQNDVRQMLDLPDIPNGDNYYMQVNMMPLNQFAEGANLKQNQNKQNENINNLKDGKDK